MKENFNNLVKEIDIQVANKLDPKRAMLRHIIIRRLKAKDRILKAARENHSYLQRKFP